MMFAWPSWFPPAKQVVVVEEEKAIDVEKQAMSVWKSILKRKGLPLNTPYKYVESFGKDYDESYCDMLFIKAKKIKEEAPPQSLPAAVVDTKQQPPFQSSIKSSVVYYVEFDDRKREKKRQKSINGIVYEDPEVQNKKRLLILKSREENASVCLGNIVCITNLNSFSSSDTPTFWLDPSAKFFLTADSNERVKSGDSVLVNKSPEEGVYPALVGDIHYEDNDKIVVVERYYSPEQTLGGRRSFHGNKELIATDHLESISSRSIQRKCFAHSFYTYTRLKHVGPYDYFSRFHYMIGGGWLTPDPVDVYHPACINMKDDEAKQIDSFTCDECCSFDINQASSSADPDILETLKQQLEEQARAAEELVKAAEEQERAAEERQQAAEQARAAEERERAAKERRQAAEERQRAAQKRIKELEEQVKESANMMIPQS
ncbi:Bromo adjacent homology (BAH) domain-containing protein [Artemisia annua]|uniref:Bromo adjacent homology (BAH) domain-containing protein n=1 Tax=Artemisia annua TaxID=35608 RepID=A0A2U1PL23_ARTAN|nr:Bromo adjacent homology (BAH) domain-containing protein [Artemisia annua]